MGCERQPHREVNLRVFVQNLEEKDHKNILISVAVMRLLFIGNRYGNLLTVSSISDSTPLHPYSWSVLYPGFPPGPLAHGCSFSRVPGAAAALGGGWGDMVEVRVLSLVITI